MFPVTPTEINGISQYITTHRETLSRRGEYWREQGERIIWREPFKEVCSEDMERGIFSWFYGGRIAPVDTILQNGHAENAALMVYDGDEHVSTVTYAALFERATDYVHFLRTEGVQHGHSVALYLPNSLDFVAALIAISALGAVAVPLSTRYPGSFVARVVEDCGARILFSDDQEPDDGYRERLNIINTLVPEVVRAVGTVAPCDAPVAETFAPDLMSPVDAEDPLFLYYHSTGAEKPKGYVFTAGGFPVHTYQSYGFLINDRPGARGALIFKGELTSVAGMAYGIWGALLHGDTLVVNRCESCFTVALVEQIAAAEARAWLMVTPGGFNSMKESLMEAGAKIKHRLEKVILFGDVVSPRLARYLGENVVAKPENVVTLYMQRQTGVAVLHTLPIPGLSLPGSMGVPAFGVRPGVFTDFGAPCGVNQSGQLALANTWPGMASTIFRQQERFYHLHFTRIRNHYASGDGVRLDEQGCFWFMKRLDDVFKLDGFSISTTELEALLAAHADIREAVVIGLEGGENGDKVALFVTPEDASLLSPASERGELFKNELLAYLRDRIGEFALPYRIVLMSELPRTRTGKVVRRILHRLALDDMSVLSDISHVANPDSLASLHTPKERNDD